MFWIFTSLSHTWFVYLFYPVGGLSFHSPDSVLSCTFKMEAFHLMKYNLFSFVAYTFSVIYYLLCEHPSVQVPNKVLNCKNPF